MKITRKFICKLLVFALVASLIVPIKGVKAAESAAAISVTIDGKKVSFDVQPVIKDDRVLVPFRALFEAFGATVDFNNETKTIFSLKQDEKIVLRVDSKTAMVNGTQQNLDVSPSIINGRAMVPLRFIGENYNGQVNWNGAAKQVTILTNNQQQPGTEKPPVQVEAIPVYLNHVKLSFDAPPVNLNNRVYVPLESFLSQMGDDINFQRNDDEIYIEMDGASITIYVGKNYSQINGSYVTAKDVTIMHKGMVYAPVRFITDLFGGSSYNTPGTSEIRMVINRTKLRSEYLSKEEVEIVRPINVPSATFSGNRRLMVSDNPENLNRSTVIFDNATLWEDTVDSSDASMDHRVYGWHVNQLGKKVKLGITIENLSQTNEIEITNARGIHRSGSNTWSHNDVGLPLAEAVLNNILPVIHVEQPVVKANETVVINSFEADNEYLIGFLKDFTVNRKSGSGNLSYKVRVVVSQTYDDLREIKLGPVQTDKINSHPRGIWKSSQLETVLPAYEAGSQEIAYSISNGVTDNLLSAEESLGSGNNEVMKNPGHYGATYKVKIPIVNYTGEPKTVRVRLGARGGMYNGAVKVNNDKVYMIPILKPGNEVVNVIDYTVQGQNGNIELEIMHSGGSALPVAIDLVTLN